MNGGDGSAADLTPAVCVVMVKTCRFIGLTLIVHKYSIYVQ